MICTWIAYGILDQQENNYTSDEKYQRAFGISLILLSTIFLLPQQRLQGYPFDFGVASITAGFFLIMN
jgi:hypothetical protein